MSVNLEEQIKCAQRELELRRRVYKKAVDEGRLDMLEADYEIEVMEAIVDTLRNVKEPTLL